MMCTVETPVYTLEAMMPTVPSKLSAIASGWRAERAAAEASR